MRVRGPARHGPVLRTFVPNPLGVPRSAIDDLGRASRGDDGHCPGQVPFTTQIPSRSTDRGSAQSIVINCLPAAQKRKHPPAAAAFATDAEPSQTISFHYYSDPRKQSQARQPRTPSKIPHIGETRPSRHGPTSAAARPETPQYGDKSRSSTVPGVTSTGRGNSGWWVQCWRRTKPSCNSQRGLGSNLTKTTRTTRQRPTAGREHLLWYPLPWQRCLLDCQWLN